MTELGSIPPPKGANIGAVDGDLDTKYANLLDDVHELFAFYRYLNILVKGDDVYTYAKYVSPVNEFWAAEVDRFLEAMLHELNMEKIRHKHFGAL
ncbi:hypothetical protein BN1723_000451 [Verticillium longisporum]|uniref:Uncharacterized protein n=1 Tax=Verticillium longisporum TaxID=100787 RepID=A0A0G4M675_VERLO|nr:hypothetical protein BN1723_000451 [Verticillium longisporum]